MARLLLFVPEKGLTVLSLRAFCNLPKRGIRGLGKDEQNGADGHNLTAPPMHMGDVLCLLRCTDRTGIRAGPAADALIGVDLVFAIPFGNCLSGANLGTCTARNTIVRNLVCHVCILLFV